VVEQGRRGRPWFIRVIIFLSRRFMKTSAMIGCIYLSLLFGCGESTTKTPPAFPPTAPKPVSRDFDVESGPHAAGKKVFVANGCFRCHTINLVRGPWPGENDPNDPVKSRSGPDLGATAADPMRDVAWFTAFIRNVDSKFHDSKMPSYDGKIGDQDLRALTEYLATLKAVAEM